MKYRRLTPAEGAAMIEDGVTIGFSGFTPNGIPKAVIREIRKKAEELHAEGKPYQVGIVTGASGCQSLEGDMAKAHAIKFRGPFSTNRDFRIHTNLGEIDYEDMHLGHVAERLRRGYYGPIDWAFIEVSDLEEGDDVCKAYLTTASGIVPTIVRLAKHIMIEWNHFHNPNSKHLHDVYECKEYPNREPIPLLHVGGRIGTEYVEIDPKKIVGVVESNIPEEARAFKAVNAETQAIGENVVDFFLRDMKTGHIPAGMFPIQSGVGATGNAVLEAIGSCEGLPPLEVFSEVVQDAVIDLIERGRITQASCTAMTCTNEKVQHVYENMDFFRKHLTLRPSELANGPELIRRFGVIAMNTALECDIYGNENSSHICGSSLMNGIGGSCDYERNGSVSIFYTPSTAKGGTISAIVPMCCHVDSTEHDVDIIVTEQGVADLRGKGPVKRAHEIIEHCAHPDYRPLLRDYLKHIAPMGHEPQSMTAALAFHDTFLRKGDMRLTDFGEYLK
jgi:acetyl-coA hydrolase/transferase family protein